MLKVVHVPGYNTVWIFLHGIWNYSDPQTFDEEEAGARHHSGCGQVRLLWSCFHQCQAGESSPYTLWPPSDSIAVWVLKVAWRVPSSPGVLSGLVHETWRGTAKAGPRYVSAAQPCRGCSQGSVWRGAIRDQRFPEGSPTEIWTADERSFSKLAGMTRGLDRQFIPSWRVKYDLDCSHLTCCEC